uniref:CDP-diacylglycerol--inositol 3-phosphatidyltransferase-like n=1 Tax=Styela clava TaxID=7725 RepID=UPI00193A2984|nr:CDP-diacylglycerol--inositol 3-phosphatidyltransferase-like [Styela clava]
MSRKEVTARDVMLFAPNLVSYARIIVTFTAFYFIKTNYIIAFFCLILSIFLDEVDGRVARFLNQCTRFGEAVDMISDRVISACVYVALVNFYPEYTTWFQMNLAIDVAGHWMHFHVSHIGENSHKNIDIKGNFLLRLYYTSPLIFFVLSIGHEVVFALLYLLHFTHGAMIDVAGFNIGLIDILFYIGIPIIFTKSILNLVHLSDASQRLAAIDAKERSKIE